MLSLLKNFIFAHLKDPTEPRKTTTRRAIDCLDDRMTILNEIHRKRFVATSSDPTGTITPDHVTALTSISFEAYSKHNSALYLLPSYGCLSLLTLLPALGRPEKIHYKPHISSIQNEWQSSQP